MSKESTYGVELEKPIAKKVTGLPGLVNQDFFKLLGAAARQRGQEPHYHYSDIQPETILGVTSEDIGDQGLDNAFNNQETASKVCTNLSELAEIATLDLETVQDALTSVGGTAINMANHPLAKTDQQSYPAYVAPKSIYGYLWHRGWDHAAGIDAKAQNSPSTGVDAYSAADAVSVIIGVGAANIGLFGNSPFAEGKASGVHESRLQMWDRMMKGSRVPGDIRTARFPEQRFRTMAEYFQWMHGGNSGIHFITATGNGHDYKSFGDAALLIDDNPSVLEYLSQDSWNARRLNDVLRGENTDPLVVKPDICHMEAMQFAQFTGARIRYGLQSEGFPTADFVAACNEPNQHGVERIFEQYAKFVYIEGRDPGANFPDSELQEAGSDIARSVVMAPSALQAGLIRNLEEASAFIDGYNWQQLGELREAAIRDGLSGTAGDLRVKDFTEKVVEIAAKGLHSEDQKKLRYAEWVLETERNGADRAISYVAQHRGSERDAIKDLVLSRQVKLEK